MTTPLSDAQLRQFRDEGWLIVDDVFDVERDFKPILADYERIADDIAEEGFAPLKELMAGFAEGGGTIYVCSPCFKKRDLDEDRLVPGAKVVGGAKLVEFLAGGSPCVSY